MVENQPLDGRFSTIEMKSLISLIGQFFERILAIF
jgi:hypothetical protein